MRILPDNEDDEVPEPITISPLRCPTAGEVKISVLKSAATVAIPPLKVPAPAAKITEPPSNPEPAMTDTDPACRARDEAEPTDKVMAPDEPEAE
jgi:hypothetical protein